MKSSLFGIITYVKNNKEQFVRNPDVDFTRKSKLDLETMIKLVFSLDGTSTKKNINNFFSYKTNTPTSSALVQQRDKLKPEAFEYIFREFTSKIKVLNKFKGYRLLACDGSSIRLAYNANDNETYRSQAGGPGYNALHLNALYDVLNHVYVDVLMQGEGHYNECQAFTQMIGRTDLDSKTIVMADRGYESYNDFEHVVQKGCFYLIRVKDRDSNGILSGLNTPEGEFDIRVAQLLTRKPKKSKLRNPLHKVLSNSVRFDFLNKKSRCCYPFVCRAVRFKIGDDAYETLITNLDDQNFPPEVLKELYHLRWGIETSFRDLKYSIGVEFLHSKKTTGVLQEVFAKLTVYNFCQAVIVHANYKKYCKEYAYQINVTNAMHTCRYFLRNSVSKQVDIEDIICKDRLPIRPGRSDKRKQKLHEFVSFTYRAA